MFDLEKLSAEELDGLIAEASEKRAQMNPPVPSERPTDVAAIVNPLWYVTPIPDGTLLQIRHAGLGWLEFIIPAAERLTLMSALLQQAIAFGYPRPGTAETTAPGSGGHVH